MSTGISPENEQFISSVLADGSYQNRDEVLDEAISLLKCKRSLLRHIDEGTRQLRNGDYTEFDAAGIRRFFAEVQSEGQRRYEASKPCS